MEACNAADLLRGSLEDDRKDEPDEVEVEVLDENWIAFQVFRACQPTFVGMAGAVVGIAAVEIYAAVRLLCVPRAEWDEVTHKVHYMGERMAVAQAARRTTCPVE